MQAARHGAEGYTSSRMPQSELPVQDLVGKLASSEQVIQLNLVSVTSSACLPSIVLTGSPLRFSLCYCMLLGSSSLLSACQSVAASQAY